MFKRVLSITPAVGLTVGLMGCSRGEKTESAAAQTASIQAGSAQEAAKAPETVREASKVEGEKKESEAQAAGNSGQAAPVKASEGFPNKNVTLTNSCGAGGTFDIPARIYADYISSTIDEVVMNITDVAGSGGAAGAQQVVSSPGDGYTLLVTPTGYAIRYAKGSCEFTYEDFKPVSLFVASYLGMAVNTPSSIKAYEDLVQTAEDRPGELKSGMAIGRLPILCVLAVEKQGGVDFNIVDIGGTTLKAPELSNNRINVMIDSLAGLTSYVGSGDFTTPGLYTDDRFVSYPDVPISTGPRYETDVTNQIFGIWASKDTPDDVVEYLSSLFGAAVADEGVQEQLTDLTHPASYIPATEYVTYLEKMYADFQEFTEGLNQTQFWGRIRPGGFCPIGNERQEKNQTIGEIYFNLFLFVVNVAGPIGTLSWQVIKDISGGPATYPRIILIAPPACSLIHVIRILKQKEEERPDFVFIDLSKGHRRFFLLVLVVYVASLDILGFMIATIIYPNVVVSVTTHFSEGSFKVDKWLFIRGICLVVAAYGVTRFF